MRLFLLCAGAVLALVWWWKWQGEDDPNWPMLLAVCLVGRALT